MAQLSLFDEPGEAAPATSEPPRQADVALRLFAAWSAYDEGASLAELERRADAEELLAAWNASTLAYEPARDLREMFEAMALVC